MNKDSTDFFWRDEWVVQFAKQCRNKGYIIDVEDFKKRKTMSKDSNEFQWDDKSVAEILAMYCAIPHADSQRFLSNQIRAFKASKAPSPVIENQWIIDVFKNTTYGNNYMFNGGGYVDASLMSDTVQSLEFMLSQNEYHIHQVRRVSDLVVFAVGDITNHGLISKLFISGNIMVAETNLGAYGIYHLSHAPIPQVREVLLTTEDGVGIYEDGDYVWVIGNNWNIDCFTPSKSFAVGITKKEKIFSTKELAENYVLMNRAVLSIQDVLNISEIQTSYRMHVSKKELIQLAKQKIDNNGMGNRSAAD